MDSLTNKTLPFVTPLKQIFHPKGDVYHALKASDNTFVGFGEVYFTTINQGETKGWKKIEKERLTRSFIKCQR